MAACIPKCPLINTARLKPIRQRVNKVIMTVTDSGHVSLELLGTMNNQPDGPEIAKELFHVSPDGKQIEIYQNAEGVAAIEGCPVSTQPDKVFLYPDLPDKLWRMYQHAYKFVDVIKSKTPKIILMTDMARCLLMENGPCQDFQAIFNDGVTVVFTDSKVTIAEDNGNFGCFDVTFVSSHVTATTLEKVELAKKCHLQCLEIQESVNKLQAKQELFPLSIGTKTAPFKLASLSHTPQKLSPEFLHNHHPRTLPHTQDQMTKISQNAITAYNPYVLPLMEIQTLSRTDLHSVGISPSERLSPQQCDRLVKPENEKNRSADRQFPIHPFSVPLVTHTQFNWMPMSPENSAIQQEEKTSQDMLEQFSNFSKIKLESKETCYIPPQRTNNTTNSQRLTPSNVCDNTENVYYGTCQSSNYATPKKSSISPAYNPHFYSVDSIRHQQFHKAANNHSLTLGALVDETDLKSVRRNLFLEETTTEPPISPSPMPDCLAHDLPDIPTKPSVELSICEGECIPDLMSNPLDKQEQENEGVNKKEEDKILSLPFSNDLTQQNQKIYQEIEKLNSSITSDCLSSQSTIQASAIKVLPAFAGSLSTGVYLTNVNSQQAMSMDFSQQVTPSNSGLAANAEDCSHNSCMEHSSQNSCASSSCSNSSRNTSWCANIRRTKQEEKLNKSDLGSRGHYLPMSPQKQFLMSDLERCKVDLTRPSQMHNSLDMSISSCYSDSPSSSPSSGCDPIRQVFVPYTGWASFYASGAVWILYNDGTQLGIKSAEATMTYIDQDGNQKRYKNSDVIPEIIKIKLEKLPMVLGLLMKSSPVTSLY